MRVEGGKRRKTEHVSGLRGREDIYRVEHSRFGRGRKAFAAEQSLTGERALSGMNATDSLFDLDSCYSSTFPIDV